MSPQFIQRFAATMISAAVIGSAVAGEITLFEDENFRGNSMRITSEVASLDGTGMNDRAQSAIVRDGVWEICRDANFSGGCTQLQPGRYSRIDGNLTRNISSVREVGATQYMGSNAPYVRPATPGTAEGWAQAMLYEGHDFQGRSFPMSRNVIGSLDRTGFNDRAGSLRVTSGYWVFCSDANFQGECRTFGPGEYPNLPRELDGRISSGRQISNAYPYSGAPQWDRH